MNKLKIAHDYFMKHGSPENFSTDIAEAWEYADRMIEQEQRREDKTRPEVLLDKEWQPDWSQAPDGYNWFCVGSNGGFGFFSNQAPELFEDYYFVGAGGLVVNNHDYKGDWKDSLRKRP